jgi:hypothetical protein
VLLGGGRGVRPIARLVAYQGWGDGRLIVLSAVALYVSVAAIAWLVWHIDLRPWLGIPPGPTLFFDTRNVLAALECQRLGYDPLVDNPCDPWQRPMFYPRVWLVAASSGLDQSHTNSVGAMLALLFLASVCLLVGRIRIGEGLIVALAVCSPAVMFALERGNMDVLLFSVLTAAVLVWRRGGHAGRIVSPAVVLLAAVSKLYPVFGLPAYLLLRSWRAALAMGVCLVVYVAYVVGTREDVAIVAQTATQGQYYSYGARILLGEAYRGLFGQNWEGGSTGAQAIALLVAAALGVGLFMWSWRMLRPEAGCQPPPTPALLGFYLGGLIYLGTFMIFKNYDYRLVYLLLTLPQLLAWVKDGRTAEPRTVIAALGLTSVLAALWVGAFSEALRLMDELVSWAVAGLFLVLLASCVPGLSAIRKSFDPRRVA